MKVGDHDFAPIIKEKWPELARKNIENIASSLHIGHEKVKRFFQVLQKCHPKPGLLINQSQPHYVYPDVFVRRTSDGSLIIEVNDRLLPRLTFQHRYAADVSHDPRASDFVQSRQQQYKWLTHSLDQRYILRHG